MSGNEEEDAFSYSAGAGLGFEEFWVIADRADDVGGTMVTCLLIYYLVCIYKEGRSLRSGKW